jgi:hypothetical protein
MARTQSPEARAPLHAVASFCVGIFRLPTKRLRTLTACASPSGCRFTLSYGHPVAMGTALPGIFRRDGYKRTACSTQDPVVARRQAYTGIPRAWRRGCENYGPALRNCGLLRACCEARRGARVAAPCCRGRQVSTFATLVSIDGGPQSMVKRPSPERAATAALRRNRPFQECKLNLGRFKLYERGWVSPTRRLSTTASHAVYGTRARGWSDSEVTAMIHSRRVFFRSTLGAATVLLPA